MTGASGRDADLQVLMLGEGWFPDRLGGLNRYFRDLFESLPSAHAVVIGPGPADRPSLTVTSKPDAATLSRLLRFTWSAHRLQAGADLVDAHFALYALLPMLLPQLRRKPWMVHFQGPWSMENLAAGKTSRLTYHVRRELERAVYSHAEAIVTLTSAFRQILVEQYGIVPWRVHVLPPSVDTVRFAAGNRSVARSQMGYHSGDFVVCCVRRLTPRMGHKVLLEAWSEVAAHFPHARLVIAGDGELRRQIESDLHRRGLSGSVQMLGRISDDELTDLYHAADLNVVPSVALEGFGLTVLEAAAAGTPSLVTRAGGLPEAVSGLGTDLVVEAGQARPLAERLMAAAGGALPTRAQTASWGSSRSLAALAQRHRELQRTLVSPIPRCKRRVVYLDHVANLSGGELALLRLLQATTEVQVHVILAEDGPLVSRLNESGISVEVLAMPASARLLRRSAVSARTLPFRAVFETGRYCFKLARRLRQIEPDIVHANSLKAGVYGLGASRLAGVPFVWSLHDRLSPEYLPRLGRRILQKAAGSANAVIYNSETTRATWRASAPSFVVAPPIATQVLGRHRDGESSVTTPALMFGIVGRLTPWKGQDLFIQAFADAFPDGPHQARVIGAALFGSEEESYAASLLTLTDNLGVSDRIEFRGFREDIPAELGSLDVLVHASTIPEPFGQVVAEGMAAGLVVLAAAEGGPAEMIDDRTNGLLYPPGDTSALSTLMREVADMGAERARISTAASGSARHFTPEIAAEQVFEVYQKVLPEDGAVIAIET